MMWAVEANIPDGLGGGMDGHDHAQRSNRLIDSLASSAANVAPVENEAKLRYTIASTLPDNWIPFVPFKKEQDISDRDVQLQRAAMPRIVPGFTPHRIRPHSSVLQEGGFSRPYYIYEEEVPRSGRS